MATTKEMALLRSLPKIATFQIQKEKFEKVDIFGDVLNCTSINPSAINFDATVLGVVLGSYVRATFFRGDMSYWKL